MLRDRIAFVKRLLSPRSKFLNILPQNSIGIELGVFKGEFSKHLLQVVKPSELHLVDVWWELFGENYPNWGKYTDYGNLTTKEAHQLTLDVIREATAEKTCKVHVGNDIDYLVSFDDNYFDWAYIDSSHTYEQTVQELELLNKKVKPTGFICGHDWQPDPNHRHHGVYKAVKEFVDNTDWDVVKTDIHTQWALRIS